MTNTMMDLLVVLPTVVTPVAYLLSGEGAPGMCGDTPGCGCEEFTVR